MAMAINPMNIIATFYDTTTQETILTTEIEGWRFTERFGTAVFNREIVATWPPNELRGKPIVNPILRYIRNTEILEDTAPIILVRGGRQSGKTSILVKKALNSTGKVLIVTNYNGMASHIYRNIRDELAKNMLPEDYSICIDRGCYRIATKHAEIIITNLRPYNLQGYSADYILIDDAEFLDKVEKSRVLAMQPRQIFAVATEDEKLKRLLKPKFYQL